MPRYRMTVRYDGTDFAGSQIQPGQRTVQGTLKAGLDEILNQETALVFASRTDTGVHAEGNVCAFDAQPPMPVEKLLKALNSRLPCDLEARSIFETEPDFNPRFAAEARRYVYRIWNGADVPLILRRYSAKCEPGLDLTAMQECLSCLNGRHSFMSFANGSLEADSSICRLSEARLEHRAELIELWFCANRFLHNMICRLCGGLIAVGAGKLAPRELLHGLEERVEFRFRPAPAKGLTLEEVIYPPQAQ